MNVYITYDRYEHDEWHSVYHLDTNKARAIKHCREVDLFDFISYGPDDCHSFQLQKVIMTRKEYERLRCLVESPKDEPELEEILTNIFQEIDYDVETIISTDGCTDLIEVLQYYCEKNGLDYDDYEVQAEAYEKLSSEDGLFEKTLKEYIKIAY